MRKQTILIIVLAALLAVAVGFIGWDAYSNYKLKQQNEILRQGAQLGYQQAIVDVAAMAAQCQQVPLVVVNRTINVVAVECLQTSSQQAAN